MSTPLDGVVSRPGSFDPRNDYELVLPRRDAPLGDYDLVDLQLIRLHALEQALRGVYREGAIIFETGGTFGPPQVGVVVGSDALVAGGTYVGTETQVYTIQVVAGGGATVATYTWKTTGADSPRYGTETFSIRAVAPDAATGLADLATYGHAVGIRGLLAVFVNATGVLTAGNTWQIEAVFGANPPVVSGTQITVGDVDVYLKGTIRRIPGATLTYAPASTGISVVYAELTRRVVTHVQDAALRDPPSQTAQAWREQWRVVLSAADTSGAPLGDRELERRVWPLYLWDRATNVVTPAITNAYAINLSKTEGAVDAAQLLNIPQSETFRGVLATRTAGAHGSFVVAPLAPAVRAALSTNTPGAGKIRLAVSPLVASVVGVMIERATWSEIEIDQATDTGLIVAESHVYSPGANPFRLNQTLGPSAFPIKQVNRLVATVQIGTIGSPDYFVAIRSAVGDIDTLGVSSVVALLRASSTNGGGATYAIGTDCILVGNQIQWLTGTKPAASTAYYVVLQYRKSMAAGSDFDLIAPGAIDFTVGGTPDPVNETSFDVDYEEYLPRTDLIVLRSNGALAVVRGLPAEGPTPPLVPLNTLPIVWVEISANNPTPRIRKAPNDAVSMEELNALRETVIEIQQNLARQDLLNQARVRTSGGFIDIFAEAFATDDLADLTYNVGGVAFNATIDTEARELSLPFAQVLSTLARTTIPAGQTEVRLGGNFYTLPYSDELALESLKYSTDQQTVNPFADYTAEPSTFVVLPTRDEWADTSTVTSTRTRTIQNGRHQDARIVRRISSTTQNVTEIPAVFMRQLTLTANGGNAVPGERIRVTFAGKLVTLTAAVGTTQGPDANTVLASSTGAWAATFPIPASQPIGTVAVESWGDSGLGGVWPGGYTTRGAMSFTALGVRREIAIETRIIRVQNDPIAQSVVFTAPRMISKIDVPISAKPASGTVPLITEIRATDRSGRASTPVDLVLYRNTRTPSQVTTGAFGVADLTMADPVLCEANEFRAIVLRSADKEWRVYVAKGREYDKISGQVIASQQITGGIFLRSSNNVDWDNGQDEDLRCRVYVAKMTVTEARLYCGRVTAAGTTGLYLAPDQVVPDGTSIVWQYSVDGFAIGNTAKAWLTFEPFALVELGAVTSTVDVRALLRTTDPYLTPAVRRDTTTLVLQQNQTVAKYVSRRKDLAAATTTLLLGIEIRDILGATPTAVSVSLDDGGSWASVGAPTGAVPVADGFTAYTYVKSGLTSGAKLRVQVVQTTTDAAKRPRARQLYAFAQ